MNEMKFCRWENPFPCYEKNEIPNIILDMDLGGDCDDLGAIAIIYNYVQQGKAHLVATANTGSLWDAGAMSAINRYFGHDHIPHGCRGTRYAGYAVSYGKYLATRYTNQVVDTLNVRTPVEVYREALAGARDGSITFCATGTLVNLYDLLRSEPDQYSKLTGEELIRQKVKWVICMGCWFPEGREWNIKGACTEAVYVNANWPTPIIYAGWEIGAPVMTAGRTTLDHMDQNNPVRVGYEIYHQEWNAGIPRNSWDPLTAYFACEGYEKYYELHRGDVYIDPTGYNRFYENELSGARGYLTRKDSITDEEMGHLLDKMIMGAKGKQDNRSQCAFVGSHDERIKTSGSTITCGKVDDGVASYDGEYCCLECAGDTASMYFHGTGIVIYGGCLPTGGIVDVYLDDVLVRQIDSYCDTYHPSSYLWSAHCLEEKEHFLQMVVSDQHNSRSYGNTFMLEFVKVEQ